MANAPPGSRAGSRRRRGVPVEFGPLAALLGDPAVTDVFVNPDGVVWADRGEGTERASGLALSAGRVRELAVRLISCGGRHIDEATPCVDVRLGDGIRVHAVLPPVAGGGAAISIRATRLDTPTLDDLVARGYFMGDAPQRVRALVRDRANLLISGAAGSGKTTLLAALLSAASPSERIVVIEDVAELRISHPHVVALEARQPNVEGTGAVPLDRLVREALRMRPDRIVIGECRGAELRELLSALNTGHDGGAGTIHANSLADVPARLESLGVLAGLSAGAVARQAVSALDAVLHVERGRGGRRLAAIGALGLDRRGRLAVR